MQESVILMDHVEQANHPQQNINPVQVEEVDKMEDDSNYNNDKQNSDWGKRGTQSSITDQNIHITEPDRYVKTMISKEKKH